MRELQHDRPGVPFAWSMQTEAAPVHAADGDCCDCGRSSGHSKRFEMPIGSLPTARVLISGQV